MAPVAKPTVVGLPKVNRSIASQTSAAVDAAVCVLTIATALIALAVSLFLPMRVSEDDERQGLDIASHGERGWEFD